MFEFIVDVNGNQIEFTCDATYWPPEPGSFDCPPEPEGFEFTSFKLNGECAQELFDVLFKLDEDGMVDDLIEQYKEQHQSEPDY